MREVFLFVSNPPRFPSKKEYFTSSFKAPSILFFFHLLAPLEKMSFPCTHQRFTTVRVFSIFPLKCFHKFLRYFPLAIDPAVSLFLWRLDSALFTTYGMMGNTIVSSCKTDRWEKSFFFLYEGQSPYLSFTGPDLNVLFPPFFPPCKYRSFPA